MKRRVLSCFLAAIMACSTVTQTAYAQELSEDVIESISDATTQIQEESETLIIKSALEEAADEVSEEATVEATTETTEEATVEATVETTVEATVEATIETTVEATVETTAENTDEISEVVADDAAPESVVESIEESGEAVSEADAEEMVLEDEELGEMADATYGFTYELNDKGQAVITDITGTHSATVVIPGTIDGYTVVALGTDLFAFDDQLEAISIPDSVVHIGNSAFHGCTNLQLVQLPSKLEVLEESSFYGCTSLTSIVLPATLRVGADAFGGCDNLADVTLSQGMKTVPEELFSGCKGLQKIEIPSSVTMIDTDAFRGCVGLESVTMAEGLERIERSAFEGCTNLVAVSLPKSLKELGHSAFEDCTSLTSIVIPKNLSTVSIYPFAGCTSLRTAIFEDGRKVIPYGIFEDCSGLEVVVLPNSVTIIDGSAFAGCSRLKTINLPSQLKELGTYCFSETALSSVVIPKSLEETRSPFQDCKLLTTVTFEEGMERIPDGIFEDCPGLEEVVIPDSVYEIGYDAFYKCTALKNVTFGTGLKRICARAFKECTALTSVTLPQNVTSLGTSVFEGCTKLEEITLSAGITEIPDGAFKGCSRVEYVILPYSVTAIGDEAFMDCVSMSEIMIPVATVKIGKDAFANCGTEGIYEALEIGGTTGSYAETYAKEHNLRFWNESTTVSDLSINRTKLTLRQGEQETLVLDIDGTYGYLDEVPWKSSNPKVASVTNGKVTALGQGKTTISVTLNDLTVSCVVTVSGYKMVAPALKATADGGKVVLTWNAIGGANGYEICRSEQRYGTYTDIARITDGKVTSFVDNNTIGNKTYYYGIKAYNSTESSGCTFVELVAPIGIPDTKVTMIEKGVKVSWNEVNGAESYYVYRKEAGGSYTKIATVTDKKYYTDKNVVIGKEYVYAVKAVIGAKVSGIHSATVKVELGAPVTTATATDQVTVTWNKVFGAEGYRIYRKEEGGSYTKIGTVKADENATYSDTTAVGGKTYYYAVKAYAGNLTSSYKSANVVVPLATPTPKITHLDTGVKVSWNEVNGAEGYYVYRKLVGGTYEKIATVNGKRYFLDKTAVPGKKYYYTVKAYAGSKVSGYTGVQTLVPKR